MISNAFHGEEGGVAGRHWRFANCEFDEASRELRLHGAVLDLESKPLEVLYQLLLRAGEVVTKEELLESVWPSVTVVEGSLATAVSKLRKALGEDDASVILTLPRIGYRLGVPVVCKQVAAPAYDLGFKPGGQVPGRDQWRLVRLMHSSPSNEVWLAEHPKTHESRVFKFAADGVRLRSLKREVTLARLLKESLGDRADFVRVLEWNFDTPPFYLESEFCGTNLREWAGEQGGLAAVPPATRVAMLLDVARAVAAAHDLGVLHKDLKPANILVAARPGGGWQIKVADFGSGSLGEPSRLSALGITVLGFTQADSAESNALTGTLMYLPPEVLAGQSPTVSADIYALGVILYQLIAGDFRKPLAPGWEAEVADPLLREDIAAAAAGNPARRLPSVAPLIERLESLDRRRQERTQLDLAQQRAIEAERRLGEARARRPWIAAAVLALAAGLAVSLALYRRASQERDRANHQTALAAAVNRFLSKDLLGRSDPFHSGQSDETLLAAVTQASPNIDRQFPDAPDVAARLHQTIAQALDSRSSYPDARREYDRATALFRQSEGALSEEAIVAQLQLAAMEARVYQDEALSLARSIVAREEPSIARIPHPRPDLPIWLDTARGMIALIDNDIKKAAQQFQIAYDNAAKIPSFDEGARFNLKQKVAFTSIRLGDGPKAEKLFRELIAAYSQSSGPDSPSVLRVRLNLAQAFMIGNKPQEALQETKAIYPEYLSRLGPAHELTMQVLSTQAACEGMLGLWDDAIRDDQAIYKLSLDKQGPNSFYAIGTLSDMTLAQCRAGRYGEGEPNGRKAYQTSKKAFGARAGLTGGAAYALASCWIGHAKFAEASGLLGEIDGKAVAQLEGVPDWFANLALAQGEIAFRTGRYADARKYLESAAPVFSRADAEPYQKRALDALTAELSNVGQK